MLSIEYILLIGSVLILFSIIIARLTDNLGVPSLLLFLGIGMLAGFEGPGGIFFDDAALSQSVGIIALVVILFAGGMDTQWRSVRPVVKEGITLATFGVLITAAIVGFGIYYFLHLPLLTSLLIGAITSSTDAAAVFAVLRSHNVHLKGNLKPLLELESGSNDPMAVFLTIGIIQIIQLPDAPLFRIVEIFLLQMGLGAVFGFAIGRGIVFTLNHLRVAYEGLYPVFTLAGAGFTYAVTASIGGSGFLAVYIAGIIISNSDIVQKRSLLRFFDGLAWLGQITMFLTLGLLVFPSELVLITGSGLLISFILMFIARPVSVLAGLAFSPMLWREKIFISWVGLRGAVPIVLATFPLIARVDSADLIFNIVFFIVLTSALLQGWTIPLVAKALGVHSYEEKTEHSPLEFEQLKGTDAEIIDIILSFNADAAGRSVVELGMPPDSLIVLINRNGEYLVPSGGTILQAGDTLLVLVNKTNLPNVKEIFTKQKKAL
ncbi:MAG: potassium/proton antiporter [Bacteroidetes bacterium]|nr:potassium/proton antiporter [Bacteroidota bacterium]